MVQVAKWLKGGREQIFRIFGYAGTGKTTIAQELAKNVSGTVLFAAFTGKAAMVMQSKGCWGASTIHSLIYKIVQKPNGKVKFVIDLDSPLIDASLLVVDECSMVDEDLAHDILRFGTKVLVLGDPAQLPPVKGTGFFTEAKPNIMLTEVHRQAKENPIIRMSMIVREGGYLNFGSYGTSSVIRKGELQQDRVMKADQVLVGMNKTRRIYNGRMRTLNGFRDPLPVEGDRLVCLRNNQSKGIFNGGTWSVDKIIRKRPDTIQMLLSSMDSGVSRHSVDVSVHPYFFFGMENELEWQERRGSDEFDYGYALTVHKSQGSQWGSVILFDESAAFREDRDKWLYTGITRAADSVLVVRD